MITEEGGGCYLETLLPAAFDKTRIALGTDLIGDPRSPGHSYPAGPIASLRSGVARTPVW